MDLDKTLKNITNLLKKKSKNKPKTRLSDEIQKKVNKIEEYYKDYLNTKDESYLTKYINLIFESRIPNRKQYFLRKIDENKVVLDKIIEDDLYLSYDLSTFFASDLDLLDIFIKHRSTKVFVFLKEDILLKQYEGTTLLEYLIKNNLIGNYWIDEVNEKIIIDLLIKYGRQEYLKYASENVLLMKYDRTKTVLEYVIENDYAINKTIKKVENPIVYDLLIKYNKTNLLKYLSNKVLSTKRKGKTILEILLDQNILPELDTIYDENIVKILIRNNQVELLEKTSKYLLLKKIPKTKYTLFECLLIKNIIAKEAIDAIKYGLSNADDFLEIIVKHKRLDLLSEFSESELLQDLDGESTLLEMLIKNNIKPENIFTYSNPLSIEILYENSCFEELKKCDQSLLKKELPNGKFVYEELIDRDLAFENTTIDDDQIIETIFKRKKTRLYYNIRVSSQLKKHEDGRTYLEHILEEEQTNKEIDLSRLTIYVEDLYKRTQMYIIYAKYGKQNYLPRLGVKDLLEERSGKKFIDMLLDADSTLTIEKIIDDEVKEETEIAMIIKLRGQKQENIKFESITTKLEREYLTNLRFEYEAIKLDEESEAIIEELFQVMDDKKSDPYLVYALVASYRKLLADNSRYAYEIKQIIEIKKNNPEFILKYVKDGAYFSVGNRMICMEDANIDTLNHEMGHALHHFLTEEDYPEGYVELMEKLKNDKTILEKTKEYSKRFQELKSIIEEEVEDNYMKKYDESITEEKLAEIQGFLDEEKTIKKLKYLKLGYAEETIDVILDQTYTLEEYLKQDRRVKKNNMVDLILRTRYASLLCTADYLDAIHRGKFKSDELTDSNSEPIKSAYGHGIAYYRRNISWAFSEMIANYSEIVKSKNAEEGLLTLRYYIGDELVDYIKNYYDNNILNSQKYIQASTLKLQ